MEENVLELQSLVSLCQIALLSYSDTEPFLVNAEIWVTRENLTTQFSEEISPKTLKNLWTTYVGNVFIMIVSNNF